MPIIEGCMDVLLVFKAYNIHTYIHTYIHTGVYISRSHIYTQAYLHIRYYALSQCAQQCVPRIHRQCCSCHLRASSQAHPPRGQNYDNYIFNRILVRLYVIV